MNKIRSITEAFSMQPATFYVGMDIAPNSKVSKIVIENIRVDGDPYEYCVGYDESGNRLFEFRRATVNIMYDV